MHEHSLRLRTAVWGLALIAASVACVACVTAPSPSSEAPPQESPPPSKAYGRAFLDEALHTFRFVVDPEIAGPVREIGERLAAAARIDIDTVHFFVIDEPQPNAFAIPGGYIFVFTGLLTKLEGDEELAGVLAHELGHVSYNHFFADRDRILALNLATVAALLLSGGHPAALAFGTGAGYHLQLSYSRSHEAEADAWAVNTLVQAGYDPGGLAKFFQTLEVYERFNPPSVPAYFTTHPGVADRIRVAETMAERMPQPSSEAPHVDWGRIKALLGTAPDDSAPSATHRYLRGVYSLHTHRLGTAIDELRSVLSDEPHHGQARSDLAFALLGTGNREMARHEAERALQDAPTLAGPHVILGILDQDAGDYEGAAAHFRDALAREPGNPTTHLRLASTYASLRDTSREAFHLGRHFRLSLDPRKAVASYRRIVDDPRVDPELRRAAQRELAVLNREGI